MMGTVKWCVFLVMCAIGGGNGHGGCPAQELILPCRCLLRDKEFQIWCSHSDLPRVLDGLKSVGQYIYQPIDELILENNNLPSLPGKAFLPLKVMRLMLRHNSLERVSNGWLSGLEDSLMELFIVEPELRSLPDESLQNQNALEAITIQTALMKRLPRFSNLAKLRYIQIESLNLVELTAKHFQNLPSLEKLHIIGSPRLDRLEADLLHDLPRLQLMNVSFCGVTWMHVRAMKRLPRLSELSLIGNKINDAGMIGRASRDLPALEIIRLDFNNVDRLSEAAFVDLPALKKLYLGNNHVTELHHGAFHRVPELRTLDLSNNHVRRVHPESFLQHSGSGLEELYLMNNDIGHVAELRALLDALPRLVFLDMSYNSLEAIPYGALRGHSTLEELHLNYNKIHMIDREAFMAMPALRELRLKNNSLSDRLEAPFWNLPALKGLDLSGNYFRRLGPRLLSNIPSLRKVDLSQNAITVLDPASFMMTPDLELLNLSHNALSSIHQLSFRHLLALYELDISNNRLLEFVPGLPRGLEYLHMAHNSIDNIPSDLDLPSLKMLNIFSNSIQRINAGSLHNLSQLRKLFIGRNALQQLEENSLDGLSRLEVLDVKENRISKLHPHALKETRSLLTFNIRENRLDVLIPEIFQGVPNLKRLDISKNQLTEILPGTLENTRDIQIIDASHNSLVHLPPGLYGMKKLKILDLTDNRLKTIHPDTLSSLVALQELKMSHNFVQELRRGAFDNLPNLKILKLDNNELVDMESKSIHALPVLKTITLSNNRLREIPNAAFSNLPNLQMAELQENDLRLVASNAFQQIPHLVMLNLSSNHIVGLEDAGLRSLRSLEMLDLSNNQLSQLASPSLEKMEWLVELRLDNNKICSVHGATFNGMPRLRVLSLKNNKMVTFPEYAVQKLRGNIAVLDIDGNPLACTCSLLWLRAWLQEQSVMGPRCTDGTLLREMRLSRQECSQEERYNEPVASGCEAELLSVPGTSQVFHQPWSNLRENRTKPPIEKNNVAPSPEESEYFYDEYVDYPAYNDSQQKEATKFNSSHYTPGDTPVIYAASGKNKTKVPDTPKGVIGSPSSSGFTFFGLPLPSLNLNNILGSNVRMTDAPKLTTQNAERKAAIVNKPTRHMMADIHPMKKPPDLPAKEMIIGMRPPSHLDIQTGGFVPVLPGNGGFTPIVPFHIRKNFTNANIERVNATQITSASKHFPSTSPPLIDPTNVPQSTISILSKRGPYPTVPQPTTTTTTTTTTQAPTTTVQYIDPSDDEEEYEEVEDFEDVKTTPEIQIATNASKIPDPEIETAPSGLETFEDIFKEVIENVSLPPAEITTEKIIKTTEKNVENLLNFKDATPGDLLPSYTNNIKQNETKNEIIGTPLSALLVPGGQQPQFRPSGRPSITKVQNPHASANSPLQSDIELAADDNIVPLAHNREGKNGFIDTTSQSTSNDNMNWYFANYNKTNLEPYIGNEIYPSGGNSCAQLKVIAYIAYIPFLVFVFIN